MQTYRSRLMAISEYLKTTSFFWEKELLHQKISELPLSFHAQAINFKDLEIDQKVKFANYGHNSEISSHISFAVHNKEEAIDSKLRFIKDKKRHELSRLSGYLDSSDRFDILDLCGGVGHLPQSLLKKFPKLKSVTFDFDKKLIDKGQQITKATPQLTFELGNLRTNIKQFNVDYIFGLHTCGDLANHAIKHYLNSNSKNFIGWGCCYHKLNQWEPLSEFGKSILPAFDEYSLTLAAKCYKVLNSQDVEHRYKVKRYRYALEMLMENKNTVTGSLPPKSYQGSFFNYLKIVIPETKITEAKATDFYNKNLTQIETLIAMGFHRDHWGRLIEVAITIDRALYLEEQGCKVDIVVFFDRAISPRNLALVARKGA